mgnify:CR=1 FL=1
MNSAQHQRKHAGRGKDFIVLPLVFVLLTAAAVYLALSPVVKPYLGLARVFFSQNSQNAPTDRFTGLSEGLATSGEVTVDEKPVTGDLIGRIDIEEAGISVPLYYGDNSAQLNQGAGLYPGAWLPGQERTVLAAGHTGTFFRGLGDVQPGMEIRVTTAFDKFRDQFPAESADLGAGLEFAGDYFRLLETLERDRLPDFEAKFRELLRQQSMQNLSQLRQYLTEERRDILQRLELVNESLHVVPFNVTNGRRTFLRITTQERMLPEVVEFRKRIRDALEGAWDVKVEDGEAEKRFAILAELVSSLKDLPENRRYRDTVLDVRRHVDFIGEEVDDDGRQIEVYRSGAGKSGGQRQMLTTTCLAAALRYQLCGDSVSVATYALVVLDEAFDKADSDFTTLAMNIFRQFGFQMIVATPDKAVTTLEPFIGGACVVHIVERKYSSVLTIPYDGAVHRLVWKAPAESAEPVKEA